MTTHSKVLNTPTMQLAERAAATRIEDLPDDIIERSVQCLLDYVAVAMSGCRTQPVDLLLQGAQDECSGGSAGILGRSARVSPFWAAWVNGASAHVNVYDDVNMIIPGHGSATTFPAVLAVAEKTGATGRQVIEAFVAGYETTCAIGGAVNPSHYDLGYHASSTIGSYGASAAVGRLLGCSGVQIAEAMGIASTMAGGLKGVFGTMAKCVQVGRAPATGVIAANLARRGMTSGASILEHPQGFVAVQSRADWRSLDFDVAPDHYALRDNLFKYFAACYMAVAPIECALALRVRLSGQLSEIERIIVRVNPSVANVCNIERPRTYLEAKYSIRTVVAMGLSGISPEELESFVTVAADYTLVEALAAKVEVNFDPALTETESVITLERNGDESIVHRFDAGMPEPDLGLQRARLIRKFARFVDPVLGTDRSAALRDAILDLPSQPSLLPILSLASTVEE